MINFSSIYCFSNLSIFFFFYGLLCTSTLNNSDRINNQTKKWNHQFPKLVRHSQTLNINIYNQNLIGGSNN